MYCERCGTQNSDNARFCQKCGNDLEGEQETRVAMRPGQTASAAADEKAIFSTSPTLLFVKIGYALAVIAAFALVAFVAAYITAIPAWAAVVAGFLILLIPAYFHMRRKLIRYTLHESTIEIDSGLISRKTRNVPLGRIQDVTVASTFTQRLLGFGSVIIDNASEDGGKIILEDVNSPRKYADMLLQQIRHTDRRHF